MGLPVPGIRETAASLDGLRRILRLDPGGIDCFNATVSGFWNSFFIAILTWPLYLVQTAVYYAQSDVEAHWLRFLALETASFAIGWLLFPVVMIHVARSMDAGHRYLNHIVAYNWFQLVVAAALLPLSLLQATGLAPQGMVALLFLLLTSAFLLYGWFIAQKGLQVGALNAAGVVILDIFLSLLVNGLTDSLLAA